MNSTSSPQRLEEALEMLFPQSDPAFFTRLEGDLIRQAVSVLPAGNPRKVTNRAALAALFDPFRVRRWAAVAIGVIILLGAIVGAIGPQRVLAAVRGWFGFIPGIGFVDHPETVRVLSEPVSITRDGVTGIPGGAGANPSAASTPSGASAANQNMVEAVADPSRLTRGGMTVTLEDAVADTTSTRINLQAEGSTNAGIDLDIVANPPIAPKSLALPDGTEIPLQQFNVEMVDSVLKIHLTYQPLPENAFDATLTFTQIPGVPPGEGPEGWQIPLHFTPGQGSGRIIDATPLNLSSPEHQGITMVLESLAQTPGMAALRVRLEMSDPDVHMDVNWERNFSLADANGNNMLLGASSTFDPDGYDTATLQVPNLEPGGQYTLKLQGPIQVVKGSPFEEKTSRFTLDLGANPLPGQSWPLDQSLEVGGKVVHLSGAHLDAGDRCGSTGRDDGGLTSLIFDVDPQPELTDLMIGPLHPTPKVDRVYPGKCVVYQGVPTGIIEFKIWNVTTPIDGAWEVPWQMPDNK